MNHVIYADSLFAVNFSMDFLALYISAKLMHMKIRPLRLAGGAAFGALFALVSLIAEYYVSQKIFTFIMIFGTVSCALVMSAIAFGGHIIGIAITYGAVNIGLGGIMTAIYSIIGRWTSFAGVIGNSGTSTSPIAFIIISLISGAVSLLYGKLKDTAAEKKQVCACIGAFGKECVLTLLCDSGNLLRDPFSGKPVVIVTADALKNVLPSQIILALENGEYVSRLTDDIKKRIRMIPASSVTGFGVLFGFIPDYIIIEGRRIDALTAITPQTADYGGCDGIIPQTVVTI